MAPHLAASSSHVFGLQAQWLSTPPTPHLSGAVHIPQCNVPLHPSEASPQSNPRSAHVFGVHVPAPHWLGAGAPHTCMPGQLPQGSVLPQPSEMVPHLAPTAAQV